MGFLQEKNKKFEETDVCVCLQWTRVNCDVARNKTIRNYFMFSGPEGKWRYPKCTTLRPSLILKCTFSADRKKTDLCIRLLVCSMVWELHYLDTRAGKSNKKNLDFAN